MLSALILLSTAFFTKNTDTSGLKNETATEAHPADYPYLVCYYNASAALRGQPMSYVIENIPDKLCTHLVYGPNTAHLISNDAFNPFTDLGKANVMRFHNLRVRNPGIKLLAGVGGDAENDQSLADVVRKESSWRSYFNQVSAIIHFYNLDGLVFCTKHAGRGKEVARQRFVRFLSELKKSLWGNKLQTKPTIVAACVPGYVPSLKEYDTGKLVRVVDLLFIRTDYIGMYDEGLANVPCPLFDNSDSTTQKQPAQSIRRTMEYLEDVLTKEERATNATVESLKMKMVFSLPLYGKKVILEDAEDHNIGDSADTDGSLSTSGPYTAIPNTLAYYEVCQLLLSGDWVKEYSREVASPYSYFENEWIGYDSDKSLSDKAGYILNNGYGGVMAWSVDMDDFRGMCGQSSVLLRSVYQATLDKRNATSELTNTTLAPPVTPPLA